MPPHNPNLQMLRAVELFQGLAPLIVSEIARRARPVVYGAGERLVCTGARVQQAILIRSGQAVIARAAGAVSGDVLTPGSLIHELGMFVEMESGTTVIARTQVSALAIRRDMMLSLIEEEPTLADYFNHKIAARVACIAAELRRIDQRLEPYSSSGSQYLS